MSDRLDKVIAANPLPSWLPIIAILVCSVTFLLIWAANANLDDVTTVEGKVVPKGENKVVQHLEGGIIKEIYVHEGSQVKEGQLLLLLDARASNLKQDEIEAQLYNQMALRARLEAEANGRAPIWPEEVRQRRPDFIENQQASYDARKKELESSLDVLRATLHQKEQEVKDLTAKEETTQRNLQIKQAALEDLDKLIKDKLVALDDYRKAQADVEDLKAQVNSAKEGIVKAQASVAEANGRLKEKADTFKREAQQELGATVIENIGKLREELTASSERGARLEVKSPTDGIVKNMRYQTIGGVVKAGEPIMEIVPTSDSLVISAKLKPEDRGFVSVGQPAKVKVLTYDPNVYGSLDGEVAMVAADAIPDDQAKGKSKGPFFEVVVETRKNYLGKKEGDLPITPGMQTTVDIHTGKRTVLDLVVLPVLKASSEMFRER